MTALSAPVTNHGKWYKSEGIIFCVNTKKFSLLRFILRFYSSIVSALIPFYRKSYQHGVSQVI